MTRLAFVSSPLDRNANNRTKADFVAARRSDSATHVVQIAGDTVRMDVESHKLFTCNDAPETEAVYLGEDLQGQAWFARPIETDEQLKPIRTLMLEGGLPPEMLSILAQARSILHWHDKHGF